MKHSFFKIHDDDNIELLNDALHEGNLSKFNQLFPKVLMNLKPQEFPHLGILFQHNKWHADKTTMFHLLFDSIHCHDSKQQQFRDYVSFLEFFGSKRSYPKNFSFLSDFVAINEKFIRHLKFSKEQTKEVLHLIETHAINFILPTLSNTLFQKEETYISLFLKYAASMNDEKKGEEYINQIKQIAGEKINHILNNSTSNSFLGSVFVDASDKGLFHLIELGARLSKSDETYLAKHRDYELINTRLNLYQNYLEKETLEASVTQVSSEKRQLKI